MAKLWRLSHSEDFNERVLTVYSLYDFDGTIKRTFKLYVPIVDRKENPEGRKSSGKKNGILLFLMLSKKSD